MKPISMPPEDGSSLDNLTGSEEDASANPAPTPVMATSLKPPVGTVGVSPVRATSLKPPVRTVGAASVQSAGQSEEDRS